MEASLRKQAEKKVKAKMDFYTCLIVFSCISVVLIMLSFYLWGAAFWLRLPIPIFVMILGVLYLNAFGWNLTRPASADWKEEEIEREMNRLYQRTKGRDFPLEELSEDEKLELMELDRLKRKWETGEDFV